MCWRPGTLSHSSFLNNHKHTTNYSLHYSHVHHRYQTMGQPSHMIGCSGNNQYDLSYHFWGTLIFVIFFCFLYIRGCFQFLGRLLTTYSFWECLNFWPCYPSCLFSCKVGALYSIIWLTDWLTDWLTEILYRHSLDQPDWVNQLSLWHLSRQHFPGDICPCQKYLSCHWFDFEQIFRPNF